MYKKCCFYLYILCAAVFVTACHSSGSTEEVADSTLVLNEALATDFARQIEQSVLNEVSDFFNNAFDKASIRQTVANQNSIVSSAFDTDFGRTAFDNNFRYGDFAVSAVQAGGDFRFLKYYVQNGEHHLIFRIYNDFGLKIDDFTLFVNADNEIKIKEAYIYNMSATFSDVVLYDLLYCTLMNTEPDEAAQAITTAEQLLNEKKFGKLYTFLQEKKELIGCYPYYNFFYINALNETSPHFIQDLEELKNDSIDERFILVHKLIYYTNAGKPQEVEATIQKMIDFTGEDPIYWVFYAEALAQTKQYEAALKAYTNAEEAMPTIWDIWAGKLRCFYRLHDQENFQNCLNEATDKFGMTAEEIQQYVHYQGYNK